MSPLRDAPTAGGTMPAAPTEAELQLAMAAAAMASPDAARTLQARIAHLEGERFHIRLLTEVVRALERTSGDSDEVAGLLKEVRDVLAEAVRVIDAHVTEKRRANDRSDRDAATEEAERAAARRRTDGMWEACVVFLKHPATIATVTGLLSSGGTLLITRLLGGAP